MSGLLVIIGIGRYKKMLIGHPLTVGDSICCTRFYGYHNKLVLISYEYYGRQVGIIPWKYSKHKYNIILHYRHHCNNLTCYLNSEKKSNFRIHTSNIFASNTKNSSISIQTNIHTLFWALWHRKVKEDVLRSMYLYI